MDNKFHDLLTRYVNGNCTPEEVALIERWHEEMEDKDLQVEDGEKESIKERIFENIQYAMADRHKPLPKQRFLQTRVLLKVAASVAILMAVSIWFWPGNNSSQEDSPASEVATADLTTFENSTEAVKTFTLPDGSKIELESGGKMHFDKDNFSTSREVHLTGRAFFDIVKDPAHPFYVYSGKIATRVLGTSFIVDAPADAVKVGVKVITGRVSVFPIETDDEMNNQMPPKQKNSTSNGVVLSPNQKVEYFIEEGHWVIGLVEDPVPIKTINEETYPLVFENATIEQVLTNINARYGIEVVTENEKIYHCIFTGDVSKMSLYDMLDAISNSISATYEVKGTRILISGTGCY